MSIVASRYADYSSACPRCQQIIQTIDLTFQQGIFIYDLTFIQQELESVLVAALQRQNQLGQSDGQIIKLPLSSMVRLPNGKKPRDFKAERDRRRKALGGQLTQKRRKKKSSSKHVISRVQRERQSTSMISWKKQLSTTSLRSDTNSHQSTRPVRAYRPMNFSSPFCYETKFRNGHQSLSTTKLHMNTLSSPDQFWTKILEQQQHDIFTQDDCKSIESLIDIDQTLLSNIHDEKVYQQYQAMIHSKDYLLSSDTYLHPELQYSLVLKQNSHFYRQVQTISSSCVQKNGTSNNNHRWKRKDTIVLSKNQQNDIIIDDSVLSLLRRDNM
jgi:hypothetical protein